MLFDQISKSFVVILFKYAFVGLIGTVIDFGTTYLLKEKVKLQKYLANSLGFCTAVISNYLLNRYWTFNSSDPAIFQQFGKFIMVSLVGLILNNAIIYLVNEKYKINFYISKIAAVLVVISWNFFINYFYTFKTA